MEKKKPIKVLFISHERKMGGANKSLFELIQYMKLNNVDVTVAVLYRGCPIDKELRDIGVKTFPCAFGWWMVPAEWSWIFKLGFRFIHFLQGISVLRLCKYVKENKIDIIHSNSSTIDIGAVVAKKTGCRHVWHFREFGKEDYNLDYFYDRDRVIKTINSYSDINVFISQAISNIYPEILHKRVIYDGITDDCFIRDYKGGAGDGICHFLVSGNMIPGKRQIDVLKAMNILNSEYKYEKRYSVIFAGTTTDLIESKEYFNSLEKYVADNGLKNVSFAGYVKDMSYLRRGVDIEIVPSKSEGYGRVTVEAMASRHIVIASRSGANLELVKENETGYMFDTGNVEELAKKMRYCIDNISELDNIKENAYNDALLKHRRDINCKEVLRIYEELV